MAVNIAARRFAKAQRRKAAVAQKKKAELEAGSVAGQIRLAQAAPIQHCLLTESLFEYGMGILVVARGATPYSLTVATFLLDTAGLGVKDAFFQTANGTTFREFVDLMSGSGPLITVDPAYARKLLRDLVAGRAVWASRHTAITRSWRRFSAPPTRGVATRRLRSALAARRC